LIKKRIKKITVSKNQDVYDIKTKKNHNFFANGILVHNCSEQTLTPFNCCNLSAINVSKFIKNDNFDFDSLYNTSYQVLKLMDNIINVMDFPDERFKINSRYFRPVGIGPMGLSDAMFMLGYRYDGPEGKKFAGEIMKTITTACIEASCDLDGTFADGSIQGMPLYEEFKNDVEEIIYQHIGGNEKIMEKVREKGIKNLTVTTCMPTGTTAISCDCSYGIEPCFGLVFQKNYIDGTAGMFINPIFENKYKNELWYTDNLPEKIFKNGGSLKGLHGIPKEVKEVFITAHDINYKNRIDIQASLQSYCSTAISSTINLPKETTIEEVSEIYKYAYEKGLKGITIYRDGSKKNQPVTFTKDKKIDIIIPFKRPSKLSASTYAVETGNGKMYVTVSDYKGKPLEVFINLGKSGQTFNTFAESVGRLISIGLQSGISVEDISKTLIGINSDKIAWFRFEETDKKPTQILSIPDGIAQLLNRYYSGINSYMGELSGEICPTCGNNMMAIEGCFSCACGYSKCS